MIALGLAGSDFALHRLRRRDATAQALAVERAPLDFRDVEPASVFGRVMDFEALGQTNGLRLTGTFRRARRGQQRLAPLVAAGTHRVTRVSWRCRWSGRAASVVCRKWLSLCQSSAKMAAGDESQSLHRKSSNSIAGLKRPAPRRAWCVEAGSSCWPTGARAVKPSAKVCKSVNPPAGFGRSDSSRASRGRGRRSPQVGDAKGR